MAETKREEIPVSGIVLNTQNFRHRPVASQEEAFAALFAEDSDRSEMLALATDIAARGLDLSSLMIVEPVDGHWRVLEGNRRIAALKVMANPNLIPDLPGVTPRSMTSYRSKLTKIGNVASLPRDVLCLVTDDRELANHLIRLKHTGLTAHKGAGTKLWDTEGRTRYELSLSGAAAGGKATASNKQTASALALLDALTTHFQGDDEISELIAGARKGGYTTLGRLLIRPENRLRLGVQMEEGGEVRFIVPREVLRQAMHRVLSDLGTPRLNSRTTNKAAQVVDYLDQAERDLPTAGDRLTTPEPAAAPNATSAPTRARRKKQPAVMRKPFQKLTLHHARDKTRALLREMKDLRIEDNAHVLAVAMRTLIDLYTADVFDALNKRAVDKPSSRAKKCLALLEPHNTTQRDSQFPMIHNALASGIGDLSVDTMNGFMHRDNYHPTPDTIRTQVSYYSPFLESLDEHVDAQLRTKPGSP